MPGRKPIFATLVVDVYTFTRDAMFKLFLEPASHEDRRAKEEKKKNFLRKERSEVSYYRTLPLPEKVHSGKAKAKLTDGVLDVVLPKITPTAKPKKRSIHVK